MEDALERVSCRHQEPQGTWKALLRTDSGKSVKAGPRLSRAVKGMVQTGGSYVQRGSHREITFTFGAGDITRDCVDTQLGWR